MLEAAIAQAASLGDWSTVCTAERQLGFLHWEARDERQAERGLVKALQGVDVDLAYLCTVWGDSQAAEQHARRAIDSCAATGNKYGLSNAYANLGVALETQERWLEARRAFEGARVLSLEAGNFGGEVFAERGLARLHRRAGDAAQSRQLLEEAIERIRTRNLPSLLDDLVNDLDSPVISPAKT